MKRMWSKCSAIILVLAIALSMMGATKMPQVDTQKEKAHEVAELARSMGLPENDPIIVRAQELWWEADDEYTEARDIIAVCIFNEAWYGTTQRHKELVAAVIVNRINSAKFPDTAYDVVTAPRQYLKSYATPGSTEWCNAQADPEIWAQCQEIAGKALSGEIVCPENVLFQAEFKQGTGTYETCKTSYSTTYFCYG